MLFNAIRKQKNSSKFIYPYLDTSSLGGVERGKSLSINIFLKIKAT